MIGSHLVAISLAAVNVFLPNVELRERRLSSCDPKAALALSGARRDSLRSRAPTRTKKSDEQWAELAASAPGGFAGAYLETLPGTVPGKSNSQRLIVRLSRPQERDAALRTLIPKLRELQGSAVTDASVVVAAARWDFVQLMEWSRYLDPHARGVATILSADIDPTHNRIAYGVRTAADRATVIEHLSSLGIPCGLIEVVVSPAAASK